MIYDKDGNEVERTPITTMIGRTIASVSQDHRGDWIISDQAGDTIALINYDGLFDAAGNFFEDDTK